MKLKLYVLSSILLFVCFIIGGCKESYKPINEIEEVYQENNTELETVIQDQSKENNYLLIGSDVRNYYLRLSG